MPTNPEQLFVTVRGATLAFESFSLTRSVQQVPSTLSVTYADTFDANQSEFIPGDQIIAHLGDQLVFTGYVDGVYPRISPAMHSVSMTARSAMRNLVDCSIDLNVIHATVIQANVFEIAQTMADPFGITVINNSKQNLKSDFAFSFNYGDTPWSLIEQAARYCGVILLDNEKGQLVIDDVGSSTMASGIKLGVNVEECSTNFSMAQRYSDVYVVYSTPDTLTNPSLALVVTHGHASDPEIKEHRPLFIMSEQSTSNADYMQQRADWEVAHRFGLGHGAQVKLSTWRDNKGSLWVPNALVDVDLTQAKMLPQQMVIASVTYSKSLQGTYCELTLLPPQALKPEPIAVFNPTFGLTSGGNTPATPSASTPPAPAPDGQTITNTQTDNT